MSNDMIEKLNLVISSLKNEDLKYGKLSYRLQFIYLVLIPVYVIIFVLDLFDEFSWLSLLSGMCYVSSLAVFLFVFRKYSKEYKNVDYALPTLVMLKKAACRYSPLRKETWWALIAVFLIDIGISIRSPLGGSLLYQQIIFFSMIIMSIGVGIVVWWFKYKPLRDNILKLIKEIEG